MLFFAIYTLLNVHVMGFNLTKMPNVIQNDHNAALELQACKIVTHDCKICLNYYAGDCKVMVFFLP